MRKTISFSNHALEQMEERGATQEEVELVINKGNKEKAKGNRSKHRMTLPFDGTWMGKYYAWKQVAPIVVEEQDEIVVVTVFTFYF